MSDTVNVTKKERYNEIKELCAFVRDTNGDTEFDLAGMIEFCDNEINKLDERATKAKERAAIKRAEGDALQEAVLAVLTDEPMTREDVLEAVVEANENLDTSLAKVGFRLRVLVDIGKAARTSVSVTKEDGKTSKKVAYVLA